MTDVLISASSEHCRADVARMTFLPVDQKDEKIWYDQHEDKDKDKGSDLVI